MAHNVSESENHSYIALSPFATRLVPAHPLVSNLGYNAVSPNEANGYKY